MRLILHPIKNAHCFFHRPQQHLVSVRSHLCDGQEKVNIIEHLLTPGRAKLRSAHGRATELSIGLHRSPEGSVGASRLE